MFRSSLQSIQLLSVAKTADIRRYGCDTLLQPFIDQLNQLGTVSVMHFHDSKCMLRVFQDEGCRIQLGDEEVVVHGAAIAMCGDTPASNHIGGFKEGVGFALRKCRRCLAIASDMGSKVTGLHMTKCIVFRQ